MDELGTLWRRSAALGRDGAFDTETHARRDLGRARTQGLHICLHLRGLVGFDCGFTAPFRLGDKKV